MSRYTVTGVVELPVTLHFESDCMANAASDGTQRLRDLAAAFAKVLRDKAPNLAGDMVASQVSAAIQRIEVRP